MYWKSDSRWCPLCVIRLKHSINFLHYLLSCSMCCCADKHCTRCFCHSSRLNPCLQGSRRGSTGDYSRRFAAFIRRRVSLLFGRATSRHSSSPFATGPSRYVLNGDLSRAHVNEVIVLKEARSYRFPTCSSSASSSWLRLCTTRRRTTARRLELTLCAGDWRRAPPRWSASLWTPCGHALLLRESPRYTGVRDANYG